MINKVLNDYFRSEKMSFSPFVSLSGKEWGGAYEISSGKNEYMMSHSNEQYSDNIYITENERGFLAKRVFKNTSDGILKLTELGIRISGIDFGCEKCDDYYYHAENPRVFQRMTLTVDYNRTGGGSESEFDEMAGNKWADPGVIIDRIGACPYQPFPAILVSNYNTKMGIVHGTLSQNVFYHSYLLTHSDDGIVFDIYSSFKDIAYREVLPSETLIDEWYLGKTLFADDVEMIFGDYSHELRKKLPANYGATSINRDNLVWGSWNDGIFRDVSEELLIREAGELVEHFPNVRWLQLDDGYCTLKGKGAHGLGVPFEGAAGVDKDKFPHGIRYVTDRLRLMGLRPAIWIGGYCPVDSQISRERPDLMCEYSSRTKRNLVLDVSIPETREYMKSALDTMIYDWGFDGVKHDFWSYAFEVSEDLLKNKNASGYEYRTWWLNEVRKRIPTDGYFQTGCDIVMGNPFLGTHFTNYRYGIDIGGGKWSNLKTNFLWCTACLATHTGDLFVPNSDAVGMFLGLSDTDAAFCVNFVLITRTMVELAGVFSKADKTSSRFKMLKKATCNINNGQDVYFAGYDYRTAGEGTPDILYIKTPHFSVGASALTPCRTVALFNTEERDSKTLTVKIAELGLENKDYIITDVWTGEQYELSDSVDFTLEPHGSRLLAVSEKQPVAIYDSNVKLEDVKLCDNTLSAKVFYPAEAELTLNREVRALTNNGKKISFKIIENKLSFEISEAGEIEITF